MDIIRGIGYPNSDLSHFRSMEIWNTCEPDKVGPEDRLGRTIRDLGPGSENVTTGVSFGRGLPLALAAPSVPVASVGNLEKYWVLTEIGTERRDVAVDLFSRTYSPSLGRGTVLDYQSQTGRGDGQFNLPWDIRIDGKGDVYVADWRNDRIQKFAPDGRFLMKFGSSGNGDGEFSRPSGVAVDKEGLIYVANWGNDRLQVFTAEGRCVTKRMCEKSRSSRPQLSEHNLPSITRGSESSDSHLTRRLFGPSALSHTL